MSLPVDGVRRDKDHRFYTGELSLGQVADYDDGCPSWCGEGQLFTKEEEPMMEKQNHMKRWKFK